MLRPGKVQVVKSTELDEGTGQTDGMIRKGAVVGMSDHLCASGRFYFGRKFNNTVLNISSLHFWNIRYKKEHSSSLTPYTRMRKTSLWFNSYASHMPSIQPPYSTESTFKSPFI